MGADKHITRPYLLNVDTLGWIEGISLYAISPDPSSTPVSHYFGGLPYALPPLGQYRFRQARTLPEGFRFGTKANPGRFSGHTAVCPQPSLRPAPDQTSWDEDCLQLNIHIPAGTPPQEGWPVFFYIHGGFLQAGNANLSATALAPLLSETAFKAIIVMPAYRLNAFGFLASRELQHEATLHGEPTGNQGFWDQRLALEFIHGHIAAFGGNNANITMGGYSAGSHSAFQQLAHELYFVPNNEAIIKRVIMWSNGPGVQPKDLAETQLQFDQLLSALEVPTSLTPPEKLARLREMPANRIVSAISKLKLTEFRALSDGAFIHKDMIGHINSGDFGQRMKARGIKLMIGECRDEHFVYRQWHTPAASYDAVRARLNSDFPAVTVHRLLQHYTGGSRELPKGTDDWQDAFGRMYADVQIHSLERGFLSGLAKGGMQNGKDILRYRFEYRASCVDHYTPKKWGVTHGTDMAIWFWGLDYGDGLREDEKTVLLPWNQSFSAFVSGKVVDWALGNLQDVRVLLPSGVTKVVSDDRWEDGLKLWSAINMSSSRRLTIWMKGRL